MKKGVGDNKEKKEKGVSWKVLLVCLLIVFIIAFIGSRFNYSGEWYNSVKPGITPPNWVFPVAWSILYILIALSLYFVWISGKERGKITLIYGFNLIANALWIYLFFGLKKPTAAFIDIILIWLSIIAMMILAFKINKKAGWMLTPYFLWVSFASILNLLIVLAWQNQV